MKVEQLPRAASGSVEYSVENDSFQFKPIFDSPFKIAGVA